MCSLLKCFFAILCFAITASRQFRFDYAYFPEIDGWLKLHLIPAVWRDAFKICEAEGTVLASPSDTKMQLAISIHRNTTNKNTYGIYSGVHATFSKGYFFSIEGIPLERMPVIWAKGEPDNADNNEECILLLEDGTIADVNCSETFPFICYKKKTKDMVMTSCGTVDKDYELNEVTGNCYKFHHVGTTWQHAFMTCAAEGGYLVIINSREEAEILKQIFDNNFKRIAPGTNTNLMLVGNYDWGDHGVWRTIHGMKLDDAGFAEWDVGQPDNLTNGQFCGAMFRYSKLDDYWCQATGPFVCEKSPDSLLDDPKF